MGKSSKILLVGLLAIFLSINGSYVCGQTKNKKTIKKEVKQSESFRIKGEIVDANGVAMPGVSVILKGTNSGVNTDVQGKFSMRVCYDDIIEISFIGMETQEIKIESQKDIKVTLLELKKELEEVVVTGYQVIEKRNLTSSVVSVEAKDIVEQGGVSIDNMLQGKISGVNVMQQTSTPGIATKIRIRGASSISGNREPIWVVDGIILEDPVPLKASDLNSMDKVNLIGNAISFINPQDIERIDILKDASATAIYGSKAANGVIVITTKKGEKGKLRVSYNGSVNIITAPTYDNMFQMNANQRMDVSREMQEKGLEFSSYNPSRTGYEGALMDLWERKIDYSEFGDKVRRLENVNTDWYNLLFRNAIGQSHNVSMSGGSDNTTYYFSLGNTNNKGATLGVDYQTINSRLNITTKIRPNLSLGINMSTANTTSNRQNGLDLYEYAYNTSRTIPAYNDDGSRFRYSNRTGYNNARAGYYSHDIYYNIFDEMDNSKYQTKNKNVSLGFNLNWNINKMFTYSLISNFSTSDSKTEDWYNNKSYRAQTERGLAYDLKDPDNENEVNQEFYNYNLLPVGGAITTSDYNSTSYTVRNSIRFNKSFEDHSFTSNIGTEVRVSHSLGKSMTNYGYLPDRGKTFAEIDLKKYQAYYERIKNNKLSITDKENRYVSFYGTASYAYKHKYVVNFNFRADGSNKFGQSDKNKFLPIWSVSGRWNLAEESWFDNQNILNQFSIRASYGTQGNVSEEQVPNLILKIGDFDNISNRYSSLLYKVPNNMLRWEKTESFNMGVDFSFFENRVRGSFEIYKKLGTDQIVSRDITSTNGADRVSINAGTLENKGWEISVGIDLIKTNNFSWFLSANTSKNYNKVTDAGKSETEQNTYIRYLNGSIIQNGKSLNSFYSYTFTGLDKEGKPTFANLEEKDKDGNMLVSSPEEAYMRVLKYSGSRVPLLNGGLSTGIRYKRVSINAQMSISIGSKIRLNKLYNSNQTLPYPQQNMSSDFVNRWRKPGDENFTNIPGLSDKNLDLDGEYRTNPRKYKVGSTLWDMYNNSDIRVVDGSFLRCRNLSVSYNVAENVIKKIGISSLNIAANISNLFIIKDKALKGRDPEQIDFGSGTIPPQRTYNLSLTASF